MEHLSQSTQSAQREEINELTQRVIGAAIDVHRELGPGLLESACEAALAHVFLSESIPFERQKAVEIRFREITLPEGFRANFIIAGVIILELKSVEPVQPVHKNQLLTCLKLTGMPIGLLINFNEQLLKSGITRIANQFFQ